MIIRNEISPLKFFPFLVRRPMTKDRTVSTHKLVYFKMLSP